MPSETVYLKDAQSRFLEDLVARVDDVENRSQAVQHCINRTMGEGLTDE